MAYHMGIFMTNIQNQTIELPINPAELKVKYETDDKSETITSLGEINQIGENKLKGLTVESTLPREPKDVHYTTAESFLGTGQNYIDWILIAHVTKKPVRMVVGNTSISMPVTISSFEYGFKDGYQDEYVYTLELKEYRPFGAKKIEVSQPTTTAVEERPKPPNKVGMGSTVIVNGQLHRDSQGNGPGQTEQNATRRISIVAPNAAYPFHVSTLEGGARGWVKESDVVSA